MWTKAEQKEGERRPLVENHQCNQDEGSQQESLCFTRPTLILLELFVSFVVVVPWDHMHFTDFVSPLRYNNKSVFTVKYDAFLCLCQDTH